MAAPPACTFAARGRFEREFGMPAALPAPRAGVAEALANIFAPVGSALAYAGASQRVFAPFGRPAQFTLHAPSHFRCNQLFKLQAPRIPDSGPHKMENFM